jgi:hypothetical protein
MKFTTTELTELERRTQFSKRLACLEKNVSSVVEHLP